MMKSFDKVSLEKQSDDFANIYSHKRYFINNLDSYHGGYLLREVAQVLEKNALSTKNTSQTLFGEDDVRTPPAPEQPYEIIGTVLDANIKSIDTVARIVTKKDCISQMLTCGTVILDVGCDRNELRIAMDYIKVLKDLLEKETPTPRSGGDADEKSVSSEIKKRHLIFISTVMTWASSKPLDMDTPDMPFIESDFRKRKPHPNYKLHYSLENEVISLARKHRSQIGALVVAYGVTYGGKEDVLHYWFQKAWECDTVLPIFGRGNNAVPIINVQDLAKIIYNLVVDFPKKLYILAVEQNVIKQKELIKSIGRCIGTGMFKNIPMEDAFLIPEIDQLIYDLITLNLNMEPTYIVDPMSLAWTTELSFSDYVPILYKQYKKETGLRSFKVVVYGPPIVGKTTLAKKICENYGLVYISPETVAQDLMVELESRLRHWETGETADLTLLGEADDDLDDDEANADDEAAMELAKQTLAVLQSGRTLGDEELLGYIRQRMLTREALNRGWVLDGYPMSIAECEALFEKGDDQDSDVEDEAVDEPFYEDVDLYSNILRKLLPDVVVALEANDDFICEKAMRQPEGDSRLDEEVILKRLSAFRASDARDITPLNFFDELDIHPLVVPVKDHSDYEMNLPYSAVSLRMGRPCRYGKLIALLEAAAKKKKREEEYLKAKEELARRELEQKLKEEREEKMEYWTELYATMREEEEAALAAASEPMRNYLVHHIFPTLTPALLEVAKLRPEDPIDFLAEHLFKLNPTGKMLEPGYYLQEEKLMGKIKILDEALLDLDIKIEPLASSLDNVEDKAGASSHFQGDDLMRMSAL